MRQSITHIALIQTVRPDVSRPDIGLGIGFLKAYLEDKAPGKYIVEIFNSNDFISNDVNNIHKFDLLGLSTVTNQFNVAKDIARLAKQAEAPPITVIGGAHISALPESISTFFDYGVSGEGEQTFFELLEALNAGCSDRDILKIPGVIGQRAGKLIQAAKRNLIKNLNDIPFPTKDYFNKYRSVPSLITARGCPYKCDFCTNRIIWGNNLRRNSPQRVVEELIDMSKTVFDIRVIVFRDDIVFLTEDYLTELIETTNKKAPYLLSIPKVGYVHVNTLSKSMINKLKDFGVVKVCCGFESASPKILSLLKQGSAKVQDNQSAINRCYEQGLNISGNFIFGIPEETEDDLKMTLDFITDNVQANKLSFGSTSLLTPFPGSRYWNIFLCQESHFDLETFDWNRLDELGFLSYYENSNYSASVQDWWARRELEKKIYIGGIPKDTFVDIIMSYEPELTLMQLDFLKKDRKY